MSVTRLYHFSTTILSSRTSLGLNMSLSLKSRLQYYVANPGNITES